MIDALVIPAQMDILATGQILEMLADVWAESTQAERKELIGLLLEAVFVDVIGGRVVCAASGILTHQVVGLRQENGRFYLAQTVDHVA